MRLICGSDSTLRRKASYISWQCKFPGPLHSWLEHGSSQPQREMGTGIKRAVTRSGHCCLPWEQFWAPCAEMLQFLPNGRELGYSLKAQGLGWISQAEGTKKLRQKKDVTPVYMRVLLCTKPHVWEDKTTFSPCHFSIRLEETLHR